MMYQCCCESCSESCRDFLLFLFFKLSYSIPPTTQRMSHIHIQHVASLILASPAGLPPPPEVPLSAKLEQLPWYMPCFQGRNFTLYKLVYSFFFSFVSSSLSLSFSGVLYKLTKKGSKAFVHQFWD